MGRSVYKGSPVFSTTPSGTGGQFVQDISTGFADRVTALESNSISTSGNNVFSGSNTFSGTVTFASPLEPAITSGNNYQYFRGDKTFQNLDITSVSGLNTSLNNKAPLNNPTFTGIIYGNGSGITNLSYNNLIGSPSGVELTTNKNQIDGYAGLDDFGKLNAQQFPTEYQIQFRRGTDSELGVYTLAAGEPGWTTDTNRLAVGDGATAGGIPIRDKSIINVTIDGTDFTIDHLNNKIVVIPVSPDDIGDTVDWTSASPGIVDGTYIGQELFIIFDISDDGNYGASLKIVGSNLPHTITISDGDYAQSFVKTLFLVWDGSHWRFPNSYSNTLSTGAESYAEGSSTATGQFSHAQGDSSLAQGNTSFAAGAICKAIGDYSFAGGFQSKSYNFASFSYGYFASSYGPYSVALGNHVIASGISSLATGDSTIASGNYSIALGSGSLATAPLSFAGGRSSLAKFRGQFAYASSNMDATGDVQWSRYHLVAKTTNNTPTNMSSFNGGTDKLILSPNSSWTFNASVSAYNSTDRIAAGYSVRGCIRRDNSSNTKLVGTNDVVAWNDIGMSVACTISADDTNECLQVSVSGITGKTIKWSAYIDTSEVNGS